LKRKGSYTSTRKIMIDPPVFHLQARWFLYIGMYVAIASCSCTCLAIGYAQEPIPVTPQPFFRNYTIEDGFPSNVFYTVYEDQKGFLWFGNQFGSIRYDGYEWRQFPSESEINLLPIFHFEESDDQTVWMTAPYGGLYFLRNDSIISYNTSYFLSDIRKRFTHTLGFEWEGEKLHSFLSGLGKVTTIDGKRDSLIAPPLLWCSLAYDLGGKPRLVNHQPPNLSPETKDSLKRVYSKQFIPIVWPLSPGKVWNDFPFEKTTGKRESMIRIDEGKYLIFRWGNLYLVENDQTRWSVGFPYDVPHFFMDKQRRIFFCTLNKKGVVWAENLEDLRQGKTHSFLEGIRFTNGIQDKQGGYWFTSIDKGVFYSPNLNTTIYDKDSGLQDENIETLALINEDSLFFGDRSYQLFLLDVKTNKIVQVPNPSKRFKSLFDLFYDKKRKELWCATGEIMVFKKGEWTKVPLAYGNNQTTDIAAKRITPSFSRDVLWVNGMNGFASINMNTKNTLLHSLNLGISLRTYSVLEDVSGTLYTGILSKTYSWKDTIREDLRKLRGDFFFPAVHMNQLPDSTMVFGLNSKGLVFQKPDKQFFSISSKQGLTFDQISYTHLDQRGHLWAATVKGLNEIQFLPDGSPLVKNYTIFNRLPSNAVQYIDSYENRIWIATMKGLVSFELKPEEEKHSPTPLLQGVSMNGESVETTRTFFKHNENLIEVDFLTLNYPMQGKIPYRYRLNGKDWISTRSTTAQLSYLSPDEYTFEVQSPNEQGKWSESAVYNFTILPPWWATAWFRSLAGIAFLGLIFTGFRLRTRQLEKKHAIQQQLQELERSALQAQMNPHFIFNCLNSIQNFIAQNEKTQAATYLARFAALIRTALDASVEGRVSLKEEIDFLNNYIELEKLRFKESFSFQINVTPSLDLNETRIPPLLIQPYLENAIIHGMKNTSGEGRIDLEINQINNILEVVIRDNGPGVHHTSFQANHLHKSVGMTITQKRIELLKKDRKKEQVEIRELKGENGVIEGTEVRLCIG
jgi:ligand-binding sensor domain-containing protein